MRKSSLKDGCWPAAAESVCVGRSPLCQRRFASRFSRLAARFSSNVLAAFFLVSFFRSMPLLIETSPHALRCPIGYTPWEVLSRLRARVSRTRRFSDFAREFCHPLEPPAHTQAHRARFEGPCDDGLGELPGTIHCTLDVRGFEA